VLQDDSDAIKRDGAAGPGGKRRAVIQRAWEGRRAKQLGNLLELERERVRGKADVSVEGVRGLVGVSE
jgi:hypothetical protein